MVKTVGPMFSTAASGKLRDTMVFVCGLYARRASQAEKFEYSEKQKEQNTKYSDGCKVWQSPTVDKSKWTDFIEMVKSSGECPANLSYYMTGFQTFMSYYLLYGPDGWSSYPNPPYVFK